MHCAQSRPSSSWKGSLLPPAQGFFRTGSLPLGLVSQKLPLTKELPRPRSCQIWAAACIQCAWCGGVRPEPPAPTQGTSGLLSAADLPLGSADTFMRWLEAGISMLFHTRWSPAHSPSTSFLHTVVKAALPADLKHIPLRNQLLLLFYWAYLF